MSRELKPKAPTIMLLHISQYRTFKRFMLNDLRLKISYLLIGLLGYLFIAQATNAASLSLDIDPPIIVINAIPPTTVTSSLNIQNRGVTQVMLQIQFKPFRAKG